MPISTDIMQYETCPVCSSAIELWRSKSVGNDEYKIDLCSSCGYSFVNPRPSLSFLMDYYSTFGHVIASGKTEAPNVNTVMKQEENEPNSTIDARRLVHTIKTLTKQGTSNSFLDVGCGYGFFSKAALYEGFDVIALELAENEREIAKQITGLNPFACSFEEFRWPSESFQVVFMSQILEHALDVNLWINKAHDLLVDDGVLAIALPNFGSIFRLIMQENEAYIIPPAHLNYFNLKSLSRLLGKYGFRVEGAQWVSRIPMSTYERRLPKFSRSFIRILNVVSSASLKTVDALHLGMMINVYARKVSVNKNCTSAAWVDESAS